MLGRSGRWSTSWFASGGDCFFASTTLSRCSPRQALRVSPAPASTLRSVGSSFPSFALPDLDGNRIALEDYRGRRVLVVNWNPDCSFCDQLAPQLTKLHDKLRARKTELLLVAHGDAQENRSFAEEHGLGCPILLRSDGRGVESLDPLGTPAAYLLDEQARVLEPLALGAPDVGELARRAAGRKRLRTERPLGESRIVRDGLKPGTPAPPFSLSAVEGGTISLEDYRGRRALLVFSDPNCGPCDELMPELVRLHRRAPDGEPVLLLISRGELEENRRKVQANGIHLPVGIQPGWRVSREYGIFFTPVAFLVDEEGLIAREVAKGPEEIVALYESELASRKEAPAEA
jgi:peroxiredoxin